jgi:hypothetical protein
MENTEASTLTLIKNLNRRLLKLERVVYEKDSIVSAEPEKLDHKEKEDKRIVYSKEDLTEIQNTMAAKKKAKKVAKKKAKKVAKKKK